MILCILLIVAASVFGAKKTVDIFGVNIFIVENDDIENAPNGSAVLVKKSRADDLEEGKLILYLKEDADDAPTLGYVRAVNARDGVHYITVSYKDTTYEFTSSKLVGRADYYSKFWGGLIRFIKTPLGIMVIAVLPCAALILYDIIRAAAANRPEPEVVPKLKNAEEEHPHTDVKLSVDTEGKALYSKDRSLKTLPKDSNVLFNYSGKQNEIKKELPKQERPIIPLTDKKPQPAAPTKTVVPTKTEKPEISEKTGTFFEVKLPADISEPEMTSPAPKVEVFENLTSKTDKKDKKAVKTAELPTVSGKSASKDAFFAPSAGRQAVPQIGKQRRAQAQSEEEGAEPQTAYQKGAGKRSTQILASKSFDDLLSDDDEASYSRGGSDRAVDDILAGLNRKI